MEKILKNLIKQLVLETINYNPQTSEVYFGDLNTNSSSDVVVGENSSKQLRLKTIRLGRTFTLQDSSVVWKNTNNVVSFNTMQTKQETSDVSIRALNLYGKSDVKNDVASKYNLPSEMLYYGKMAKNQYEQLDGMTEIQTSPNIEADAANDFLSDNRVKDFLREFDPQIILCPDSSSQFNQVLISNLSSMFPDADHLSSAKVPARTFLSEDLTKNAEKLNRALSHMTIEASGKTRAERLDKTYKRDQAKISFLNKYGLADAGAPTVVNNEIFQYAETKILEAFSTSRTVNPKDITLKIHKVSTLKMAPTWRSFLVGLHAVTYSKDSFPYKTVTDPQTQQQINVPDLMFNSALIFSSIMYAFLTRERELTQKEIEEIELENQRKKEEAETRRKESEERRKKRLRKGPRSGSKLSQRLYQKDVETQKSQESQASQDPTEPKTRTRIRKRKPLKESKTTLEQRMQPTIDEYIETVSTAIAFFQGQDPNKQDPEMQDQISKLQLVLSQLNLLDNRESDQNLTALRDSVLSKIQRPSLAVLGKPTVKNYEEVAKIIEQLIAPIYSVILAEANDFINNDQVSLSDLENMILDGFTAGLKEILNKIDQIIPENMMSSEEEKMNLEIQIEDMISNYFESNRERLQSNSQAADNAAEFLSENPEIVLSVLKSSLGSVVQTVNNKILNQVANQIQTSKATNFQNLNFSVDLNQIASNLKSQPFLGATIEDVQIDGYLISHKRNGIFSVTDPSGSTTDISLGSLFSSDALNIDTDALIDIIVESVNMSGLAKKINSVIKRNPLKRILIIDDNISTGGTFAGIARSIMSSIEEYQKTQGVIVDTSFEEGISNVVDPAQRQNVLSSQDVSQFKGQGSTMISKNIQLNSIVCMTPMIV